MGVEESSRQVAETMELCEQASAECQAGATVRRLREFSKLAAEIACQEEHQQPEEEDDHWKQFATGTMAATEELGSAPVSDMATRRQCVGALEQETAPSAAAKACPVTQSSGKLRNLSAKQHKQYKLCKKKLKEIKNLQAQLDSKQLCHRLLSDEQKVKLSRRAALITDMEALEQLANNCLHQQHEPAHERKTYCHASDKVLVPKCAKKVGHGEDGSKSDDFFAEQRENPEESTARTAEEERDRSVQMPSSFPSLLHPRRDAKTAAKPAKTVGLSKDKGTKVKEHKKHKAEQDSDENAMAAFVADDRFVAANCFFSSIFGA
eukprot:TRINITY_DN48253_c0_g1_i1.p1 TRINITY_DN48253_c0_g1~~TRINITY_DN48253_c0_g1_i1.p1  ORF type:complete len:321 (+),score=88.01 TRINITY_DN48253_c0_g1_i1:503-1465(+)